MICSNCGNMQAEGTTCKQCGAPLIIPEGQMGVQQNIVKKKTPFFINLIIWIAMVVGYFLPFIAYSGEIYFEEDLEYKSFSLIKMASKYKELENENATIYTVISVLLAVFLLFLLIFILSKKPTGIVIFSLLIVVVDLITRWDLVDRGVVGKESYNLSASFYILIIGAVLNIVGIIVHKIIEKNN